MDPFQGSYDHTLDSKNRLTVPSGFRSALSDKIVLARPLDQQPCVTLWRADDYAEYTERALHGLSPLSDTLSEFERFFYGESVNTQLDSAGRVMIPAHLTVDTSIDRDVLVVGAGRRLEIWNKDVWRDHRPDLLSSIAERRARANAAV